MESRFSSPIAESLMESVGPVLLGLGGRGRGGGLSNRTFECKQCLFFLVSFDYNNIATAFMYKFKVTVINIFLNLVFGFLTMLLYVLILNCSVNKISLVPFQYCFRAQIPTILLVNLVKSL